MYLQYTQTCMSQMEAVRAALVKSRIELNLNALGSRHTQPMGPITVFVHSTYFGLLHIDQY